MRYKIIVNKKSLLIAILLVLLIGLVALLFSTLLFDANAYEQSGTYSCTAKLNDVIIDTCTARYPCDKPFSVYNACTWFEEYRGASNVKLNCVCQPDAVPTNTPKKDISQSTSIPTATPLLTDVPTNIVPETIPVEVTGTPTFAPTIMPIETQVTKTIEETKQPKKTKTSTPTETFIYSNTEIIPSPTPFPTDTIAENKTFISINGRIGAFGNEFVDIDCTRYFIDENTVISKEVLSPGVYVIGSAEVIGSDAFIRTLKTFDISNIPFSFSGYIENITDNIMIINGFALDIIESSIFFDSVKINDAVTVSVMNYGERMVLESVGLYDSYIEGVISYISLPDENGNQSVIINGKRYDVSADTFFSNKLKTLRHSEKVYGQVNIENKIIELHILHPFPIDILYGYRSQPYISYFFVVFSILMVIVLFIYIVTDIFKKPERYVYDDDPILNNISNQRNSE